jgi:hypothetical protein
MTIKTNTIGLNVPAKVLPVTVTNMSMKEYWKYDDGLGDKWWSGGATPKPYRWELTLTVNTISHGSHLTRTPFRYDAFDILVGDFIAGATDGKALQIISITQKTADTVVCIVEDVLRYNTFRNASGIGIFTVPGQAVVFELNEFGDPMIDPLPLGIVSSDFYANVNSRFNYLNPSAHFILEKENHEFQVGDVIGMSDEGAYEVSSPSNLDKLIGTITHLGPGPNKFMIRPMNGTIDLSPGLPGKAGDFVYASTDGSGDLTTEVTGAAVFLNICDAVPSTVRGSVMNATTLSGNRIEINKVMVTFTGTSIASAVTNINNTSGHKVTATNANALTEVVSDTTINTAVYGLVGGYPPFAASINGVTVNFTTTTAGNAEYSQSVAIAEDMVADIIAANIPNIQVRASGGKLYMLETQGGSITIVNQSNDINGNPFAGSNSISALSTSYPATTGKNLLLTRADGGEIILSNVIGTPCEDFGIISGHNGSYPIGMDIEQGIRKAGITVVSDITARNSLSNVLVGDQAYVLNSGQNEWALYIWNGSAWIVVATQDSAATDANSLHHMYTMPSSVSGDTEVIDMGRISSHTRVVSVLVEVVEAFVGYSSVPTLNIGTEDNSSELVSDAMIDLENTGSYNLTPDFHYDGATELTILATLDHYGSTTGQIKITVTYV